jgi:hypothetical protein
LQPIDQTARIAQSSGKQIRPGLQIVVDHIRKKAPLHNEAIKSFLVDHLISTKRSEAPKRNTPAAANLERLLS